MRRAAMIGMFVMNALLFLACASAQEKTTAPVETATPGAPTREETAFIDEYIANLRYMVYIDEKIKIPEADQTLYRKAIATANDFLASKRMEAVVQDQVEKLKKDQITLIESETGENLTVVQWLAQKLNADVYICIDLMVASEKRGSQYYAQATLSLTVFEAATGRLLGSKSYSQLDRSVGTSEELARINAAQNSVKRVMEEVIKLTQTFMRQAVETGIRYELSLMGTHDAETILSFIDKLQTADTGVKRVESVYRTDTEGRYYVYFFGKPGDFERMIYAVARELPGLENLKLISQRGKSFSFATGL